MTTSRKLRRARRRQIDTGALTARQIQTLAHGRIADLDDPAIDAAVRSFYWTYRQELLQLRTDSSRYSPFGCYHYQPGSRPFLFWHIEHPRSEPECTESEVWTLARLRALTKQEQQAIYHQERASADWPLPGYPPQLFRRCWSWWRFVAPHRRNNKQMESSQLCKLGLLNSQERAFLADPQAALAEFPMMHGLGCRQFRYVFCYLPDSERELLGLVDSLPTKGLMNDDERTDS